MVDLLEKAISIAVKAHKGQVDKAGYPYILHPLKVMSSVSGYVEKILAVLHDVVEDTDITFEELKKEGFSDDITDYLSILTRSDSTTYKDYIIAVSFYKETRTVKLADLKHNIDVTRFDKFPKGMDSLMKRYHWAIKYLENV
jgi:(p)ppGpp synthase/HD superfamily hydrolase